MKLKELLTNTFGEKSIVDYPNDQFRKLELESLKEELLKCDEFSECEGIEFMEFPVQEIEGKTYSVQTMKLGDNTKFDGKVFLYNLSLTPAMFDPNKIHTPVKNGAAITPALYDPTTFLPTKKIVLTWSPEMAQDMSGTNDELTLRNDIHKLLDDVLDNPEEYKTKGMRHVLVRGLFEVIDNNDGADLDRKVYDLDLTANKPEDVGYKVFYLETNVIKPGEIELKLNNKIIPSHLKNKFIDEVGTDPKIITEKIIDEFLENQGINRYTGRLAEILKKGKEVEDKIYEVEKYHKEVKKMMKLKKEIKKYD